MSRFDEILTKLSKHWAKYCVSPFVSRKYPPVLVSRERFFDNRDDGTNERSKFFELGGEFLLDGYRTEMWIVFNTNAFIDELDLIESRLVKKFTNEYGIN